MAKKAAEAKESGGETIMRALRVEVVKPLNASWQEAGNVMHTIRSVAHRLYTAAALAAIQADRDNRRGVIPIGSKPVHPQTAAYRAVEEELEEIREWAGSKKRKGGDGDRVAMLAELRLPGGMKSAISSAAYVGFRKWRKDKGANRVPTWKKGAPIPCRAAESELRMDAGGVVLSFKLTPKGVHEFAVKAGRGSHWGRLRALAEGREGLKLGEVKLSYDERQKKWFAFVSYAEPAPEPPRGVDPKHVMVLHRGQRNLLVCATNQGRYKVVASGAKLRSQKRRLGARRKELASVSRTERGTGAHGHGRARRYELADAIADKEKRVVTTLCQQAAARVAELALEWGCGTVLIEKYDGIKPDSERGKRMYLERFPNHLMKVSVEWSLKKAGLSLGEYPHEFMSQTCPRCDSVDEAQHNKRSGVFHCKLCAFDRSVDFVGAIHALRRGCPDKTAGEWDRRLELEAKLAGAARKGEKGR